MTNDLTNTDKEHIGDLEVTKAFHIGEILVSKGSLTQKEFVAELEASQTKVRSVTVEITLILEVS